MDLKRLSTMLRAALVVPVEPRVPGEFFNYKE
jgi:hypothetical protein